MPGYAGDIPGYSGMRPPVLVTTYAALMVSSCICSLARRWFQPQKA